MANLKYVCLSDLHLGAAYSVLSGPDPLKPSPTLSAFGAALGKLLADLGGPTPPTLILLGDILDLGVSPVQETAMGFQRFVEALFPPGGPLSPTVLYVPGNHDHSLWQSTKERHYLDQIRNTPPGRPIDRLSPVTRMFAPPALDSALLTELMRDYEHLGKAQAAVKVVYPNFGQVSADGRRCVVFHHGHFIESMYRLMSSVRSLVEADYSPPATIDALEGENATWIDFGWSTIGGAGAVGEDVGTLYTMLQDNAATARLMSRLSGLIVQKLLPYFPMGGEADVRHYARVAAKALLDFTVERWAELERNGWLSVLSDDSVAGLRWYLEEPVYRQIAAERDGRVPRDVTFVFGHTHKPFEDLLPLRHYDLPVKLFNTGGWVLDEPEMMRVEGAAAVFVDADLNVVSLRLYNDPVNDVPVPVSIPASGAYPDKDNPLLDAMRTALAGGKDLWTRFTAAAADALQERRRWLIRRFDPAVAGPPAPRG